MRFQNGLTPIAAEEGGHFSGNTDNKLHPSEALSIPRHPVLQWKTCLSHSLPTVCMQAAQHFGEPHVGMRAAPLKAGCTRRIMCCAELPSVTYIHGSQLYLCKCAAWLLPSLDTPKSSGFDVLSSCRLWFILFFFFFRERLIHHCKPIRCTGLCFIVRIDIKLALVSVFPCLSFLT